jgi:sugar lactone lactonase YvrE
MLGKAPNGFLARRAAGVLLMAVTLAAGCGKTTAPSYRLEAVLPPGSPFHGVHGLRFDQDGNLYAASVIGQSLFTVNLATGQVATLIGPPEGMADDIAIAADGTFVWTAIEDGILYARAPNGPVRRVLEGYKGVNAVAFDPAGERLFLSLVFYGDALYEVDLAGGNAPRLIAEGIGGLNAFEVAGDGMIYGPLVFGGRVVRIDPASGEMTTVSDEFASPGALKLESATTALVLDDGAEIKRVDLTSGATSLVSTLPAGGDNLAIDSAGRVFVSLSETNAILEINPLTGAQRYAVPPALLNSPAGFGIASDAGRDVLYVGDLFGGIKVVDATTGSVEHAAVELFQPTHIALNGDSLYAVSQVFGTIQRFDRRSFEVQGTWAGFSSPGDVLVAADGGLIVADAGSGRVLRVTGANEGDRTALVSGLSAPTGLAWAGTDAVYVTDASAGRLLRVGLDGTTTELATGLSQPEGLAVTPDGAVLVVEVGAKSLTRVDPNDGSRSTIADALPIGLSNGPSLYRDVETGDGGIYFNSDIDNTIYRLVSE